MISATSQQISQHHFGLNKKGWPWVIPSNGKTSILLMGDTNIQGRHQPEQAFQHLIPTLHAAIESGADIIIGHSNLLIQAVEVINQKPIFYGLGNAAFDWYRVTDKRNGLLVRALLVEGKMNVSFLPLSRDSENDPVLLDPNFGKGQELYNRIVELSRDFGTNLYIEGNEIVVGGIN